MERAIYVKDLNKTFNKFKAVDNFNLEVHKNECFGLLGPNGAGKTTTMKIIYGKSLCDKNESTVIDVFGYDAKKDMLNIRALSGVVPQQDNLDSQLNVRDNLYIYSKFYGLKKSTALKRIDELIDFMELGEKSKAPVNSLSGGMQRRLTIARALLNNPRLLFLDEPTTGLDPQVRHLIWNKLRELKEKGVTILLTTHYMEEAFQICDRIIIMDKGKKVLEGNPKELLTKNIEKFVMEIYGVCKNGECENLLREKGVKFESYNETLFVFSDDYEKISAIGNQLPQSDYYIRHSNLEDLFLNVTGRSLNDLQ